MSIENPENQINFDDLRKELRGLKETEETDLDETDQRKTAHFDAVNVEELQEDDLTAYQKLKNHKLKPEDLITLKDVVLRSGNPSRQVFLEFLANKLQVQLMEDPRRI